MLLSKILIRRQCVAADSNLTQLAQYVGTVLVGAFIPLILSSKKKSASYTSVATNESTEDLVSMKTGVF